MNGKFIDERDAKISVNDIGLHRNYGVFEVLRTYNGAPFLLKEHLNRLVKSAKEIGLVVPYSKKEISENISKILQKNKEEESLIKILVTGGESKDGMNPGIKPTFLILTKPLPVTDKDIYKKGVKLITYEHKRFIPSAKTLNYIQLIKSFKELKKEKAFTLLYTSDGNVSEGATCNIFFYKSKKLITPKTGVLNGITRNLVIKLAGKNFTVDQKDIKLGILNSSEEVFITMTTKGIVPVVKIDKHTIGNGKPGKNTKIIMKLFDKYINNFIKCTT